MKKFIKSVTSTIPYHIDREIFIDLNFKNLIITGKNGSGKTSLLASIFHKVNLFIDQKLYDTTDEHVRIIEYLKKKMSENPEGSKPYLDAKRQIKHRESILEDIKRVPVIEFDNMHEYANLFDNKKAIILFFGSSRQSQIQQAKSASTLPNMNSDNQNGKGLEQHIVNLYTQRSFAISDHQDKQIEESITEWLKKLENQLKYLMEDNSTSLFFNSTEFRLYIKQEGKADYNFQSLSSGYSSIFSILSDILMFSEFYKVSPIEMCGVVCIDEIDAHLHLSLQRKVLPFLTGLFPSIQFICTTHSPFVISSLEEVVVYDLSTLVQVEDLSSYSFENIASALFDTPPSSLVLEKKIEELNDSVNNNQPFTEEMLSDLESLESDYDKIDTESKFFLNKARIRRRRGEGVSTDSPPPQDTPRQARPNVSNEKIGQIPLTPRMMRGVGTESDITSTPNSSNRKDEEESNTKDE